LEKAGSADCDCLVGLVLIDAAYGLFVTAAVPGCRRLGTGGFLVPKPSQIVPNRAIFG
jgi:hypothetical protein